MDRCFGFMNAPEMASSIIKAVPDEQRLIVETILLRDAIMTEAVTKQERVTDDGRRLS